MARLLVLILCLAVQARAAVETSLLFDGSAGLFTGSNPEAGKSLRDTNSSGPQISWFLNPLVTLPAWKSVFSPSWNMEYSGVNNVLKVDDQLYLFVQQVTNSFSVGGMAGPGPDTRFKFYGLLTEFNAKQVLDEAWGFGLYDYQDAGFRGAWSQKWDTRLPLKSELGYQFTDRRYPHYLSLVDSSTHEKDARIHKVFVDFDTVWPTRTRIFTTLRYSVQALGYTEAKVVDAGGTTAAAQARQDTVHRLALIVPVEFEKSRWTFEVDLERRLSNFNYFDTQAVRFIGNYESYGEQDLRLSYSRLLGDRLWVFERPSFNLALAATGRLYDERLTRDSNGAYTTEKEFDHTLQVTAGFNSHFSEHWSWFASLSSNAYRSNNSNGSTSLYNYSYASLAMGTQWAY